MLANLDLAGMDAEPTEVPGEPGLADRAATIGMKPRAVRIRAEKTHKVAGEETISVKLDEEGPEGGEKELIVDS